MTAPGRLDRLLLADIGGTHARIALAVAGGPIPPPVVLKTADFPDVGAALAAVPGADRVDAAAVCAAGPVEGRRVRLTNHAWTIDAGAIAAATGAVRVRLVNDFVAVAAALPDLAVDDVEPVTAARPGPEGARIVLGPGTGLGLGICVPCGAGRWQAVPSEGGHVDLAPRTEEEVAILRFLWRAHGHASPERVLSGTGLPDLHAAMAAHRGMQAEALDAPGIAARAGAGDPLALAVCRQFSAWLGAVAGDAALMLCARGGVFLGGGILPRWGALFDATAFMERFTAKGRFADFLAGVPVARITAGHVALRGLARLLNDPD